MTLQDLAALFRLSIADPRAGARAILGLNLSRGEIWMALLLSALLATFVSTALVGLIGGSGGWMTGSVDGAPVLTAAMQVVFTVIIGFFAFAVGRFFGGSGTLDGVMALIVWLQFILIGVQVVQVVLIPLMPIAAAMVSFIALGLFFYLLTLFVAEVHGFENAGAVFGMILATLFGVAMVISLLLSMVGVTVVPTV